MKGISGSNIPLSNQRNKQQMKKPADNKMRKTGFEEMNKDIKVAMENGPQQVNVGSGVVDTNQDEISKANFRKNSQPILESRTMNNNMTLNNYAS